MSLQSVEQFLAEHAPDIQIIESKECTDTIALAAHAHQVKSGQIARTRALNVKNEVIIIVAAGDTRLDNKKLKAIFGAKIRMLSSDEVITWTGHPVGGVCPFGLENILPVYCDISLKRYAEVFTAAGTIYSSVKITPQRLAELTNAKWVDVCQEM